MLLPIVAFFLTSFFIGIHAAGRIGGNVRNFYVAGNIIPFWVVALSLTGQAIELGGTLDNAFLSMTQNFISGAILPVGIGCSLILIGLFYAAPLHSMRILTLPDFYLRRFDQRVELIVSLLCVTSFIILLAGNLAGLGIILHRTIGLDPGWGVIVVTLPITIYTMAGGLFAVTWNDILQIGVAIIGFLVTAGWMGLNVDHASIKTALTNSIDLSQFTDLEAGALRTWATFLALALGDIIALDFMERVFAAKTPSYARLSSITAGIVTILIGLTLSAIGTVAAVQHSSPLPDTSFLDYVESSLPKGIAMMMVLGLIGAGVSTCDGVIMACSVVLTKNVLQQSFPRLVPSGRLLLISRMTAIPVALLGITIAIIRPVPGDLLVLAFDVVFAGCFIPLTLGLYWKRGSAQAAFWAILIPSVIRIIFHFLPMILPLPVYLQGIETLLPPLISLLIYVVIALTEDSGCHSCVGRKHEGTNYQESQCEVAP